MSGPVVLQNIGDSYRQPARIAMIVWEGATTAGDRIEIRDYVTNDLLAAIRTPDTHTFTGFPAPPKGINAPNGFKLSLSPGSQMIQVYLVEL